MSGSRKALKSLARHFNPRAENDWSKDDSKFGQRMLEKMGWTKGQGVGRDNQGIAENIKLQMKFDNKGLGFKITDADHLLEIESNFAHLLSNLNQNFEEKQIDDCSPKIQPRTQKASCNLNIIERSEIDNQNPPSKDSVDTFHEYETNEHQTRKTKKRKVKIVEIVEDEDDAAARSTENDVSSKSSRVRSSLDGNEFKKTSELHSTNINPSDCSEIVDLKVTNNDDKRKIKSKSKKEMKSDAKSTELSPIGIESSDYVSQIVSEKTSRKHKHKKKSKNTYDDSDSTQICFNDSVGSAINGDDNSAKISEEDETRRASDLIDTNARLEAESETATTQTHYSSKRRKCKNQEELIETNSKEIDFKRERKRKKKSNLDETDSNSVTNEVTAVNTREDVVVDEFSEGTESSRRKSKPKRSRNTPDDQLSNRKKHKKSDIESNESALSNGHSLEETFCEEQQSISSEAVSICENSSLSPSASKMKESCTSADRNRRYATDDRKLSKAERIILKARLMKKLRNETIVHDFDGSNISCISGYGNCANVK